MQIRFPGGLSKALTLSYDDGVEQDIRLTQILKKWGIKCTFNLNSGLYASEGTVYPKGQVHRRMTLKAAQATFADADWEVAVHGLKHAWMAELTEPELVWEVIKDRENLEREYGCLVRGMAYPYGQYSDQVVEVLKMCGITYARTTRSTHSFDIPQDFLRLHPTCHHNDGQLMELCDRFLALPEKKNGKLFYLWGHSYEFEGNDNWHVIENFAEKMGNRSNIWYATNQEVVDYVAAYHSLIVSVDSKTVYNPTCQTVWFGYEGQESRSIQAGETLRL